MSRFMALGTFAQLTRGVKSIEESLPFYQKLGFKILGQDTKPYPWVQLCDGMVTILLGQDGNDYVGLTYFAADMERRAALLKELGIELHDPPFEMEGVFQKMFKDPNNFWVSLVAYDAHPPDVSRRSELGIFGEFTIPTQDLAATTKFWGKLGFDHGGCVYEEPYPWAILRDEHMILGFHQSEQQKAPTLTYFAPDSGEKIAALKAAGVEFLSEMPNAEGKIVHGILKSPDGQLFNLFEGNLDMASA